MGRDRAVVGAVGIALALVVVWWSPSYDGGTRVNRPDHRIAEVSRTGDETTRGVDPADGGPAVVGSETGDPVLVAVTDAPTD